MLRLFSLLLFSCAVFWACSSDDSSSLKSWFDDQKIAVSYGKDFAEIEIPMNEINFNLDEGFDSSAYMVEFYAALGNTNSMEHILYFGLEIADYLSPVWKFRADSIFYIPEDSISATIYWLEESEFQPDSLLWLKFPNAFTDSTDIKLKLEADTFFVPLPEKLLKLRPADSLSVLRLLVGIKLHSDSTVLRIVPPNTTDIPGLLRVAHKVNKLGDCELCLHTRVGDSLSISFEINDETKNIITSKTVVFAQLILPKQSDAKGSELGLLVPVSVYGKSGLENYREDTTYVNDSLLTLQVTRSLRNYAITEDSLDFGLKLEVPKISVESYNFKYNNSGFRPAYVRYDFDPAIEAGKTAKLRLWFADYGDDKK